MQWLATGRWFSPGPLVSSTNKTDRHDLTEILLKVALNTIKQTNKLTLQYLYFSFYWYFYWMPVFYIVDCGIVIIIYFSLKIKQPSWNIIWLLWFTCLHNYIILMSMAVMVSWVAIEKVISVSYQWIFDCSVLQFPFRIK